MQAVEARDQRIWILVEIFEITFEDLTEGVELALWEGFHHVFLVGGVEEKGTWLSSGADLVKVVVVWSEEGWYDFLGTEAISVVLFIDAVLGPDSLEY